MKLVQSVERSNGKAAAAICLRRLGWNVAEIAEAIDRTPRQVRNYLADARSAAGSIEANGRDLLRTLAACDD